MSQYLALDWELHQLRGVEADLVRGKYVVRNCFALRWPNGQRPSDDPAAAGRWLAGELERLGVAGREILVSIPREDAVVRPLQLPPAPDEELPGLVRLQAATKSTVPLDQLLLDFLPLPVSGQMPGRSVLTATISRQQADRIKTVLAAAQREIVSIGLSSVAIAELIARAAGSRRGGSDGNSLAIACSGKRLEISILDRQHLLFAHSAQLAGITPEEQSQSILAETSRALVAVADAAPNLNIARVWIVGNGAESPGLDASLEERFGCDIVHLPDPFSQLRLTETPSVAQSERGSFAVATGTLLSRDGGLVAAIDFLNPRKQAVKPDRRKLHWSLAAAAVVLLVGGQYLYTQSELRRLRREIDGKQLQVGALDVLVKAEESVLASAGAIGEWQRRNVDWLEQVNVLGTVLKENGKVYLDSADFSVNSDIGLSSQRPIAAIKASGYARQRTDAENVGETLRERGYGLTPKAITSTDKDGDYPWNFVLDMDLAEIAPAAAADAPLPDPPVETADTNGAD